MTLSGWQVTLARVRKTFIQQLQGLGVSSELRAQIVGHELDDEHHATYSRDFTTVEKLRGLSQHSPGIDKLSYGLSSIALSVHLRKLAV